MSTIEKMSLDAWEEWHRQRGCSERVLADIRRGVWPMPELASDLLRIALKAPEGFVMVPVKPTDEIARALNESIQYGYAGSHAWELAIQAAIRGVK